MAKPTIIITGASGFLGTQLVRHFSSKGWQVVAFVRNAGRYKDPLVRYVEYDLAKPFDESVFKSVDYLVHAAYVKESRNYPNAFDLNVTGAERLITASRKYGLKKNVFISSMSAHEEAISTYGRQKLQIEKLFLSSHDVVLRPGLIIGDGGIVKQMVSFMKSKHMVPLIGGGRQPLQIIGDHDLVLAVERVITKDITGTLTVATPKVYSYKSFYHAISRELGIRVLFVPVPYAIMMAVLKLVALLPLSTSIGADNLRGLKKLQAADNAADMKRLGLEPESLTQCLRKVGHK